MVAPSGFPCLAFTRAMSFGIEWLVVDEEEGRRKGIRSIAIRRKEKTRIFKRISFAKFPSKSIGLNEI